MPTPEETNETVNWLNECIIEKDNCNKTVWGCLDKLIYYIYDKICNKNVKIHLLNGKDPWPFQCLDEDSKGICKIKTRH